MLFQINFLHPILIKDLLIKALIYISQMNSIVYARDKLILTSLIIHKINKQANAEEKHSINMKGQNPGFQSQNI